MTQQSYSTKIVSLHMEDCKHACPHRSVCYHLKKDIVGNGSVLPNNFRQEILDRGYTIHESVCHEITPFHRDLLTLYPNYHVTLPYDLFTNDLATRYEAQIQVTVHNSRSAADGSLKGIQKLFLIKDEKTWTESLPLWMHPFECIHFVVDQDWLTKERLGSLVLKRMSATGNNITVDSCLESHLINGSCPYINGRYIDITFDGTVRTCPFNPRGIKIEKGMDYKDLFDLRQEPYCKYKELFSGDADGTRKHTCLQGDSSDNQD